MFVIILNKCRTVAQAQYYTSIRFITNIVITLLALTIVGSLGKKISGRANAHIEARAGVCCTILGCAGSEQMIREGKGKIEGQGAIKMGR